MADLTINVIAEPNEEGKTIPYMYLRETIENGIRVKAGGRYKDLPEKAVFSYDNLVKIIEEADKKLAESGADMTGTKTSIQEAIVDPITREWKDVVKEVNDTLKIVAEKAIRVIPQYLQKRKLSYHLIWAKAKDNRSNTKSD